MRSRVQVSLSLQGKRQNIRHLRYVVSAFLLRKCSICYKFFKTIRSDKTNATPRPIVVSAHHSALISSSRRAATTLLLSATLNYPQLIIAIVKTITTPQPIILRDHLCGHNGLNGLNGLNVSFPEKG